LWPTRSSIERHRLDQLLIVASRRADGNPQGGRTQDDEGNANEASKQQQSGGEHQKEGAFSSRGAKRKIARAAQPVCRGHPAPAKAQGRATFEDSTVADSGHIAGERRILL
jgi:hypothetical protein